MLTGLMACPIPIPGVLLLGHPGHGDENPLNEHERLFWFGRRGPDYLMYLIRLGMVHCQLRHRLGLFFPHFAHISLPMPPHLRRMP